MPDVPADEISGENTSGPSKAFTTWEEAARFWETRFDESQEERDILTRQLHELGRYREVADNRLNDANQRAHDAEQRLRVAREQGWRAEWNGRDLVIVDEVLVERDQPASPWPVVTIDGLRLPWYFRSISVGDITDDLATVTLVLEAGLIVQSNEQPLQVPDEIVRDRAETLIEHTHSAARTGAQAAEPDAAETEGM